MKHSRRVVVVALVAVTALTAVLGRGREVGAQDRGYTLVGWNNLGMHCMDADFSRLLDPAPLQHHPRPADRPLRAARGHARRGITVTYEAVADPDRLDQHAPRSARPTSGTTSLALFGAAPAPDLGLAGFACPAPPTRRSR